MGLVYTEQVSRALDIFAEGMWPVIDRSMTSRAPQGSSWASAYPEDNPKTDASAQIRVILDNREQVFREVLSRDEFSWLHEVRNWRNKVAHRNHLTQSDAFRALDTIERVLERHAPEQAKQVAVAKESLIAASPPEPSPTAKPRRRLRGTLLDD